MLQVLKVSNLALIEQLELEWDHGFVAVTGETGAGKSILLGALGLLAGARADKGIIRDGSPACEVEAVLEFQQATRINAVLEEAGLPACEEGVLLLRRVIPRAKAARIYINGALTTLHVLQELGALWIDFHGPGEHQRLLDERHQLAMLDAYAGHEALLGRYATEYQQWRTLGSELNALRDSRKLSADEQDFLKTQIERINSVNPTRESIAELEQTFARAMHQREIAELSSALENGLSGDEGALQALYGLRQQGERMGSVLPEAEELSRRLRSLTLELEDVAAEYAQLAGEDFLEEDRVEQVQERMHAWLELKRKYGPEPEDVLARGGEFAHQLETQSDVEGTLKRLETAREKAEEKARKSAKQLQESREKAGISLCKEVNRLLRSLGFKSASLRLDYTPSERLREYGSHSALMLFQANPGSAHQPLAKIASSGECARVMLAIKTTLAEREATPVLVFDEVDANVGGEIAMEVGRELSALGSRHQVLCITHLPQVAGQARSHIRVVKSSTKKSTDVSIETLDPAGEERIGELARMLGDRKSEKAQAHARELLKSSV